MLLCRQVLLWCSLNNSETQHSKTEIYFSPPSLNQLFNSAFHSSGRRQWHPTPVLLPGKSHGRRSLVGCSPWGHWGSDTTERLHFHFSLLCIGEGNGNPLQWSCLENPRDEGASWAAVYGVAQSQTRLKWLNSSFHSSEELLPRGRGEASISVTLVSGACNPAYILEEGYC